MAKKNSSSMQSCKAWHMSAASIRNLVSYRYIRPQLSVHEQPYIENFHAMTTIAGSVYISLQNSYLHTIWRAQQTKFM